MTEPRVELKACPFCGTVPELVTDGAITIASCPDKWCPAHEGGELAHWNHRAPLPLVEGEGLSEEAAMRLFHDDSVQRPIDELLGAGGVKRGMPIGAEFYVAVFRAIAAALSVPASSERAQALEELIGLVVQLIACIDAPMDAGGDPTRDAMRLIPRIQQTILNIRALSGITQQAGEEVPPNCTVCHQPLHKWDPKGRSWIKAAWWCPGCATPATLEERGLA